MLSPFYSLVFAYANSLFMAISYVELIKKV